MEDTLDGSFGKRPPEARRLVMCSVSQNRVIPSLGFPRRVTKNGPWRYFPDNPTSSTNFRYNIFALDDANLIVFAEYTTEDY